MNHRPNLSEHIGRVSVKKSTLGHLHIDYDYRSGRCSMWQKSNYVDSQIFVVVCEF